MHAHDEIGSQSELGLRLAAKISDRVHFGYRQRIGDKIQIRGMLFKFFVEASLGRSRVYFRFMLVKMAKGDTLNRTTLFKNVVGNKMIDQINTERFTIVAQKIVNVTTPLLATNLGPSALW
jgi:hypothetical protein